MTNHILNWNAFRLTVIKALFFGMLLLVAPAQSFAATYTVTCIGTSYFIPHSTSLVDAHLITCDGAVHCQEYFYTLDTDKTIQALLMSAQLNNKTLHLEYEYPASSKSFEYGLSSSCKVLWAFFS